MQSNSMQPENRRIKAPTKACTDTLWVHSHHLFTGKRNGHWACLCSRQAYLFLPFIPHLPPAVTAFSAPARSPCNVCPREGLAGAVEPGSVRFGIEHRSLWGSLTNVFRPTLFRNIPVAKGYRTSFNQFHFQFQNILNATNAKMVSNQTHPFLHSPTA